MRVILTYKETHNYYTNNSGYQPNKTKCPTYHYELYNELNWLFTVDLALKNELFSLAE